MNVSYVNTGRKSQQPSILMELYVNKKSTTVCITCKCVKYTYKLIKILRITIGD